MVHRTGLAAVLQGNTPPVGRMLQFDIQQIFVPFEQRIIKIAVHLPIKSQTRLENTVLGVSLFRQLVCGGFRLAGGRPHFGGVALRFQIHLYGSRTGLVFRIRNRIYFLRIDFRSHVVPFHYDVPRQFVIFHRLRSYPSERHKNAKQARQYISETIH